MRKVMSVLFLVLAAYLGFSQNIIYVDSSSTGLNNGSSWANAYTNLDSALLHNDLTTDTIKVAKGTYKPSLLPPGVASADPRDLSFYLSLRVTLVGGYPSGGGDLDPKNNYTVLSGDIGINGNNVDNAYHVLLLSGAGATLFGITIEKGNANGGGTVTIGSAIVPRREGGGIYIADNDVELYSVIFRNNNGHTGGAVMCKNTDLEVLNCIYEHNSAYRGGAVYALNSFTVQLTNTVFYRNNASFSAGAFLPRSSGFIVDHCTFVENGATYYGGALLNSLSTANRISNSLFTGNYLNTPGNVTEDGADIVDSSAISDIRHSLIQRLRTCDTCIITPNAQLAQQSDADGIDNVWATADDGLSVTAISDAFKAGRFGYSFNDIRNTPRVVDGPFDIGAYEINPLAEIPGNIIYVDSAATGDNSGSSWLNALTSMQVAVNLAATSQGQIDTIKIAKGTYSPSSLPRGINMFEFFDYNNERTFDLPGNLVVMGGYSSGGNIRNPELFESILSSTTYHVVSIAYTPNVLLDGLTIKNGNANGPGDAWVNGLRRPRNKGGGILALNTSLVLNNCKISNNSTSTYGGGIACSASLLTVRDCLLSDNYGGDGAGGMYLLLLQTGSAITKSTFERNSSWQFGGAIYIKDDQNVFSIDSCVFKSNFITADAGDVGGGGIFSDYGANIKVTNSIFESNRAHHGAGIYVKEANAAIIKNCIFKDGIVTGRGGGVSTRSFYGITLVNCIFLRNQAAHQGGGFNAEGPASVDNCLFYENSSIYGGGAIMNPNSLLYVKNSLFYRNALGGNTNVEGSDITNSGQFIPNNNLFQVYTHPDIYLGNMLGADPKFADTTDFDGPDNIWGNADDGLRLALHSPLINEGKATTDYTVVDMDITGGARIRDGYGDVGPYESDFCSSSAFINKTLYVDSSATGGQQTGKSWADAFTNLDEAFKVKRCGCDIDTIKIAKGTYIPKSAGGINPYVPGISGADFVFYFPDSIEVLGGYPTGGGDRNYKANQTILSGYLTGEPFHKAHVAFFKYTNKLVIDGLIFQDGGFGPGPDPQYLDGESINRHHGKALYAVGSNLQIQNCIFRYNEGGAGAFKLSNCTGRVTNCIFESNNGFGLASSIFNSSSTVEFSNCIFYNNSSTSSPDVFIDGLGYPSFTNSTFVNLLSTPYVSFAWEYLSQSPKISNNVFAGLGSEFSDNSTNIFPGRITHSLFYSFGLGMNNIVGDPEFVDPLDPDGPDNIWRTNDDGLRLQSSSLAINHGHNDSIPSYVLNDIAGNPRINGGVVDMGAYECNCFPPTFVNRLVPLGTVEVANASNAECGTWEFINSPVDNNKYIIEIDKNGNAFDPSLVTIDVTTNQNHQIINGTDATTLAYRMISITAPGSYTINGGIRMRIYFDSSEIMSLTGAYRNWFKHPGSNKTIVLNDLLYNRLQRAIPIVPVSTGKINGISYVEFSNITSFSTFGYVTSTSMIGVLPVTFLSFTAVRKGDLQEALLTWKTDKETDNLVYEVQRSKNGTDWNTFGSVTPDRSSSIIKQYSFTDVSPGATVCFYRIKQVDYSGRISYSAVRKVQFNGIITKYNLNPNPASNHVEIINNNSTEKISYKIVDAIGRTVLQGQGSFGRSVYINTSALKQGMYWVYVNGETLKMIISR